MQLLRKRKGDTEETSNNISLKQKIINKLPIVIWVLVSFPLIFVSTMLFLASVGTFGPLPTFEQLENPRNYLASEIISSDGKLLGKYFKENRTNAKYEDISHHVIDALIATEDERFYEHAGIDFKGLLRAVLAMGSRGGASTITQQLAKMLFTEPARGSFNRIMQKFQEWIIAVRLERSYTKQEILTMYLNKFDFINNAVGIKSACAVYFNTTPKALKIEEASMLVGMAQNPSLYNPLRFYDLTLNRRNVVMRQMVKNNFLLEEVYDSLKQVPITLDYKMVDHNDGLAPYFREFLRADLKRVFSEKDSLGKYIYAKQDGSPYDINRDGLKIYTTIDSRLQSYAEKAVEQHLGGFLQQSFSDEIKGSPNYPFFETLTPEEVNSILYSSMKRTRRYRVLAGKECAKCGRRGSKNITVQNKKITCLSADCGRKAVAMDSTNIRKEFSKPVKMKVFSWNATAENNFEKDTVLAPIDSIKYYKSILQSGMMSVNPKNGFIKAWVGGINHYHFKYDHVKKSKRQVGSIFKPFLYAAYINDNNSPCDMFPNIRPHFSKERWHLTEDWTPGDEGDKYGGMVSVQFALANSLNTVSARIMHKFGPNAGPKAVINMARNMGITSYLLPVPSLCLGVADISVYEMVGALATFANQGIYVKPIAYTTIEDKNGKIIYSVKPKTTEALDEYTNAIMVDLLKGVVDGVYNSKKGYRTGTGQGLRSSKRPYGQLIYPMAGKTGTTQNQSDGWFVGLTPDLVTGVWVGAEDRGVHFKFIGSGQGARTALPIFGYYMQKVYADSTLNISKLDFEKPADYEGIDCSTQEYVPLDQYINPEGYEDTEF